MVKVRDLMRTTVICVEPKWTVLEAERLFEKSEISGAPVVEGGKVVGVLSLSDISRHLGNHGAEPSKVLVEEIMTSQVVTARPDDSLVSVVEQMLASRIRRVIVTDGDDHPVGIITALAVLEVYRASLRQAVGRGEG